MKSVYTDIVFVRAFIVAVDCNDHSQLQGVRYHSSDVAGFRALRMTPLSFGKRHTFRERLCWSRPQVAFLQTTNTCRESPSRSLPNDDMYFVGKARVLNGRVVGALRTA